MRYERYDDEDGWEEPSAEEAAKLALRVEAAFADRTSPSKLVRSDVSFDIEETELHFTGDASELLTPDHLRTHAACLWMFSAEAFRFYLPTFLLCELRHLASSGSIVDHIITQFDSDERAERCAAIVSSLTVAEREAVYSVIELFRGGRNLDSQTSRALTALRDS